MILNFLGKFNILKFSVGKQLSGSQVFSLYLKCILMNLKIIYAFRLSYFSLQIIAWFDFYG